MVLAIAILYFALFGWLATKNFKTAIGLLICFLPSYFIRFNIGPLPTSALEITFGSIFLVWILKYSRTDWPQIKKFGQDNIFLSCSVAVLFIFSVLGIFISNNHIQGLGIWRAYFLQPILFFIILVGRREYIKRADLIWFLSLSTLSISILAIIQKLTGQFFSPTLREQDIVDLHGRVTSFFTSPNAIGLYVAPIVPFIIYGVKEGNKKGVYKVILILSLTAIILSFSDGAWVALGVAAVFALYLAGKRKIAATIALVALTCGIFVSPLRQNLLFQNHSGQNRLTIWGYTWDFLSKDSSNFIFGAGIKDWYKKIQRPVNDFTKIEPLIFPHNIILNFWSEVGFVGMLAFMAIFLFTVKTAIKKYHGDKIFGIAAIAALIIFFTHGLVDVPYFKNDLSFLWWIMMAVILL